MGGIPRGQTTRGIRKAAIAAWLGALVLAPVSAIGQGAPNAPGPSAPASPAPTPAAPAKAAPAKAAPAAAPAPEAKPAPKPVVSEQIQNVRAQLDGAKADLEQREKILTGPRVGSGDLTRARDGIEAVADKIRHVIDITTPRLEAARERLTQLGPKPKEGEEGEDVARERLEREHAVAGIDETQRLAKSLLVQSDQIVDQVSNRRRAAFTRGLFERSTALVTPDLWMRAAADIPRDLRPRQSAGEGTGALFARNGTIGKLLLLGSAFGISIAL